MFDVLIRNASVIDGTGQPARQADVGIQGDRIAAVGALDAVAAAIEIDATGQVLAPGFIDVHNHSDGWLVRESNFAAKTLQGFTTEVLMADGIGYAPVSQQTARDWLFYLKALNGLRLQDYSGWKTFAEYLEAIDGQTSQNAAAHLPYANLRTLACGFGNGRVDDFQMREIQRQIRIGMEAGAVGVSTGLDYIVQCFATTDELVEAMTAMAPYDGLYVSHVRYKKGLLPALEEAAEIGRRAGVRVHISHLKGQNHGQVDAVFEFLERARRDVDISFDVYPYQPGSTMLSYLMPYEAWNDGPLAAIGKLRDPAIRERFADGLDAYRLSLDRIRIAWLGSKENSYYQNRTLQDFIDDSGLPAADALIDLLIEERLAVLCVMDEGDDRLVYPLLQHDLFMLGTDGIYCSDGPVHPRVFGSVGRLLGPLVREEKLLTLEQAVHRMTGYPAARFGFDQRGTINEGHFADLVVFDPQAIRDVATFEEPRQPTEGIRHVFVNGQLVVTESATLDVTIPPGRYLRRQLT
ncbi:MAG: N-acyl-D-amino-acid deacylase family protein [Planctomycetota bacterium]